MILISSAQVALGVKGAALYSTATIDGLDDSLLKKTMQDGYDASLFAVIPITDIFSFQPEISYNRKGFEVGQGFDLNVLNIDLPLGVSAVTEIDYLQVPLLGRIEFENEKGGAYFLAGPSIAMATKGLLRTRVNSIIDFNISKTELDLSNDNYNRFEFAGMLGTGAFVNVGKAKLFAEVKYHHGFSNLLNDPIVNVEIKNRAIGAGIGLQYEF